MNEWQTMETAPKDGTLILCYVKNANTGNDWLDMLYYNVGSSEWSDGMTWSAPPSRWMPLPAYPDEGIEQ